MCTIEKHYTESKISDCATNGKSIFIAEILRVILKSHSGITAILNCISLLSWLTASSKVIYFYQRVAVHPKRKGVKVGTPCQKAGWVGRGRFVLTLLQQREKNWRKSVKVWPKWPRRK